MALPFMSASCLLLQGLHDGVVRTDLQVLFGHHVVHGQVVPKCLSFHNALHVGCPAVRARHSAAG